MKKFEEKIIKIEDREIAYFDEGNAEPTLIFVHGFPFNKSFWLPQLEFLSKRYRVIAIDIAGFGNSDEKPNQSISIFADDIILFTNQLKIESAIFCGLSFGGYILLNAVVRYPTKFTGLILCDTQCIADSKDAVEKRIKTIQQIKANGIEDFVETTLENVYCKNTFVNNNELISYTRKELLNTSHKSICDTLLALAEREETCSSLMKISTPTLIICGSEDTVTPLVQAEFMKGGIAGAKLIIIENAGHLSNIEQPDAFNQIVQNYLDKLDN
jgi:3-oxoadipate enol-lactonase